MTDNIIDARDRFGLSKQSAGDKIIEGLREALSIVRGEGQPARVHHRQPRLREWRHHFGIGASDLSVRLGKGRDWVRLVETGMRSVRRDDLDAIGAALGVDPSLLFEAPPSDGAA